MRISTASNATPQSTPPCSVGSRGGSDGSAGDEQFIWRSLVPRLIHPVRLQIVEVLIDRGGAMTVEELTPLVPLAEGNSELVRYHAKAMVEAGALELAGAERARPGEPSLFFAQPD